MAQYFHLWVPITQHVSDFQQEITKHDKRQKKIEETKRSLEPDSDMTPMLDIRQRIKTNMIDMLRTLVERVDNMQEHMDNVSREMETLKRNKKERWEIRNITTE